MWKKKKKHSVLEIVCEVLAELVLQVTSPE